MTRSIFHSASRSVRVALSAVLLAATPLAVQAQQHTALDLPSPGPVDPSAFFLSGPFGQASAQYPASLAVGQTFFAPTGYSFLQSFSFWLADDPGLTINGSALKFRAYVAEWDGTKAGAIAFTSNVIDGPTSATPQRFTFGTLNTVVNAGQQYVAFLSAAGLSGSIAVPEASAGIETVFDAAYAYSGGAFVSTNAGSTLSDLTGNDWENTGMPEYQTHFSAAFTTSAVPEPSSVAMLAAGMIAVLVVARRRRA